MSRTRDTAELLELAKAAASRAGSRFLAGMREDHKEHVHCSDLPREIKARADTILEQDIVESLSPLGIPVLSEESGYQEFGRSSGLCFIVDPLDGTYNLVRALGPSAVSIALWQDGGPLFGVVFGLADSTLYWGGAGIGAFADGRRLTVSGIRDKARAALCTGFPARFDVSDAAAMQSFCKELQPFAKVRMIGSATMSLVHIATGAADAYMERRIMPWDVAAGLALVEGAGGRAHFSPVRPELAEPIDVFASNGCIEPIEL